MKNATSNGNSPNHLGGEHFKPIKGLTKGEVCLILLLERHETNTFDANRAYGDSCLHSETSGIQKKHNISVDRVRKNAPDSRSQAFLAHYFLIGNNRIKAMNMVDNLRPRRNAQPMNWEVAA